MSKLGLQASPLNLSDPLLRLWKKSPLNPLGHDGTLGTTGGPIGCTAAWKDPSGNWTTTIQSNKHGGVGLKTAFFTSHNYINWSWAGDLDCEVCDAVVTPCCDFFPLGCTDPDCTDPGTRWAFGINTVRGLSAGGLITGTFDRATLKLTPDRPDWAAEVLAGDGDAKKHFAYDYGTGVFPKTYADSTGRRISWRWIGGGGATKNWTGMQTIPNLITPAAPDDVTTAIIAYPVPELAALRKSPPLASIKAAAVGAAGGMLVPGVTTRHYDVLVSFKGLAGLSAADREALALVVDVFAPLSSPGGASWNRASSQVWNAIPSTGASSGSSTAAIAAAPHCLSRSRGCFGNNTDIESKDIGGKPLPAGTTDEQGITACTAACIAHPGCAAWVYVSNRGLMNGPRCAFKGEDYCPPIAHANTISDALPGKDTTATCKKPGPGPPPAPPAPPAPPLPPGWVAGTVNGGPLALRATADVLEVRVLVDGSVIEAFWDGGRARTTSRATPPAAAVQQLGLRVQASAAGVTADIDVWEMGNAWLDPVDMVA